VGSTLHFFGGVNSSRQEQTTHWTLDLNNTAAGWQTAPAAPRAYTHYAVATVGDTLYAFGGLTGIDANSIEHNDVWAYDAVAKTWTKVSTTPVAISHTTASTFLYAGRVWMVTGETKFAVGTNKVWSFDPTSRTWRNETSIPGVERHAAVAGVVNGTFYVGLGNMYDNKAYKATLPS
jgi:N-acetylneuraminic acid mutarotase